MAQPESGKTSSQRQIFSHLVFLAYKNITKAFVLFWLFTTDDAATFVAPNVAFGLCSALSAPVLITPQSNITTILSRLPCVIFFNWTNLLVFDLANQRLPESAREDALNKPWRPVPRGLVTSAQVRRAMLLCIPIVLAANHLLGVGTETSLLFVLTWLYNDLMGGDENWICRNVIIAAAFWLYNTGSAKVAGNPYSQAAGITEKGVLWTTIISGVILTTMHVQDLKDQEGDCARGRRLAPLVLGDRAARWTIAIPICFWSCYCTWFWEVGTAGLGVILLGFTVAIRCLAYSGKHSDRRTWELWALWTASLYILPLLHRYMGI
ncbi:UbiA prenyltransferase family [Hypoxylon crocopeplum]|nr:UbiA prenyltransferase family [Hypoxylon crocopeplum]